MSEAMVNGGSYGNSSFHGRSPSVSDKLNLFPEVHLYNTEIKKRPVKKVSGHPSRGRKPSITISHHGRVETGRPLNKPGRITEAVSRDGVNAAAAVPEKKTRSQKVFIYIILFLLCVLLAELVFHFFISSKMLIKKVNVEVSGTLELSDSEIMRLAGIGEKTFYFRFRPEEAAGRLRKFPLIREVSVKKQFPDTVTINIAGRSPLALCLVESGDGDIPVVFDREGVVFQIGKSVQKLDMLCISGIRFNELKLGMRLPDQIQPLLNDLAVLREDAPLLFRMLSEIQIVNKGGGRVEALLFTEEYTVPVRIGMALDETQLKYLFMILDVTGKEQFAGKIEEIDLRSGEVVYRAKEADSAQ